MAAPKSVILALLVICFSPSFSLSDDFDWQGSPQNWANSPYNFENSPLNFKNSPDNFQNRKDNPERINIVNLLGLVTGYAIVKEDGGVNYFNNDGERVGYSTDKGVTQYTASGSKTTFRIKGNSEK
jgi:hypothetical protein